MQKSYRNSTSIKALRLNIAMTTDRHSNQPAAAWGWVNDEKELYDRMMGGKMQRIGCWLLFTLAAAGALMSTLAAFKNQPGTFNLPIVGAIICLVFAVVFIWGATWRD
jgi:hypothetical protein